MIQGGSSTGVMDLPVGDSGGTVSTTIDAPAHQAEVETKLDVMRNQLQTLRRQQEELERQKGDLEELRRKQDEYVRGKAEMIDSLTRALVTLESEHLQAQRRAELCETTTTAFKDYLERLQAINVTEWSSTTVRVELSRALGLIEDSRLEFMRARTKLECLDPAASPALPPAIEGGVDWSEISRYCRLGAAASAPLILAGTIWLILMLVFKR